MSDFKGQACHLLARAWNSSELGVLQRHFFVGQLVAQLLGGLQMRF